MDYNNLETLGNVVFPGKLRGLGLANNKLTALDNVNFPEDLFTIWLHDNKIETLDNKISRKIGKFGKNLEKKNNR